MEVRTEEKVFFIMFQIFANMVLMVVMIVVRDCFTPSKSPRSSALIPSTAAAIMVLMDSHTVEKIWEMAVMTVFMMEPEFHDGQIAWVLQQESVANGEIGIFALNGEAYIKKLKDDKDGIFLISLNEKYAPIKVGENDRLDIFGKVLGKSDASALTDHCR